MSLDIAEAPAPTRPPIATPEELMQYKMLHMDAIESVIKTMTRKIRPGKHYRQVITPRRIFIRDECGSPAIREDFTGPGCKKSILMKALFRIACPEDIQMTFDYETTECWIPNEDDPTRGRREPITQMVINFFVPLKRSRPPRKKR